MRFVCFVLFTLVNQLTCNTVTLEYVMALLLHNNYIKNNSTMTGNVMVTLNCSGNITELAIN